MADVQTGGQLDALACSVLKSARFMWWLGVPMFAAYPVILFIGLWSTVDVAGFVVPALLLGGALSAVALFLLPPLIIAAPVPESAAFVQSQPALRDAIANKMPGATRVASLYRGALGRLIFAWTPTILAVLSLLLWGLVDVSRLLLAESVVLWIIALPRIDQWRREIAAYLVG